MDLAERLNHLEAVRDWQGLADELEKGIVQEQDAAEKAAHHLRLGRILEEKFLQGVKALKHFQDAYKLNPSLIEALENARSVYWDLGKLNMVQKLLELELKNVQEGPMAATLLVELGDVLCDAGDYDRATATYAKALGVSEGENEQARALLTDLQVDEGSWNAHVGELLQASHGTDDRSARCRLLLRAARIARRFAPDEFEGLLAQAYQANSADRQAAALFESMLMEAEAGDRLADVQRTVLDSLSGEERAHTAHVYGARWATRHQNAERGSQLLQEAFEHDNSNEAAFAYLRELWGSKGGDWDRVMSLAERAASDNGTSPFLLAQAGTTAWRHLGNLMLARSWFERLCSVAPGHPSVEAFELQIGEKLEPAEGDAGEAGASAAEDEVEVALSEPPAAEEPAAEEAAAEEPVLEEPAAEESAAADVEEPAAEEPAAEEPASEADESAGEEAVAEEAAGEEAAGEEAAGEVAAGEVAAAEEPPPPGDLDTEKLAELEAKGEKQLGSKRFNEYVKTLIEIAECHVEPSLKIEQYQKAAELYKTKFSNAAEAVKCHEAILALDESAQESVDFLRAAYEKRRDWEKLIGLMRHEADALPAGPERGEKYHEIAKLATERVKKPDVCIELWSVVIDNDGENPDALAALSQLYERSKNWESLAVVLKKQVEVTYDDKLQQQLYGKLGQILGDRLGDDEGAAEAWRSLLTLNPNDRKAQEALKKKYLALGRWDDLEVFYAETGKWDEFIRVLESQEAKEKDEAIKISLLMKTAELWITQKGKPDRSARAYEKVLNIDKAHLPAAEALIPIYTQANNAKGLAGAIEVKLGDEEQPAAEKLDLYREVAGLYESKLRDPQRAFERYLAAFEIAPADEQCVEDVERAAGAITGWEALIESYGRCIAKAEEEGDQILGIDLHLRLGRVLLDEVSRIDDALQQFRAVYDTDGENLQAISALERLYRETEKFSELLGIYEKKRELSADPDERKQILYAIADLYVTQLEEPRSAIDTYRLVLDDEPMDAPALEALDGLYLEQEAWEPYVEVLRSRIELDVDEAQLIDLKYRLGTTLEKHLEDAAGALENYREILFLDPSNDAARVSLEALLENEELRAEAASILQEIYEGRGDWEKLIQALTILAEAEADTERRVALLRKVARTAAENLGDQGRAFDAQAEALKHDPSNPDSRAELEEFAEKAEAWDRLDGIFTEIAESLSDAQLAREYWMRLAGIHERLGKVEEAARGYEHVLTIDPADAEALTAMDALYRRSERWGDLIGVFRRRIELAMESFEREDLYSQMAVVYEERLGQPEEAIAAYREVLGLDATSQVALQALDALFTRQSLWEELADNLEQQLGLAEEEELQIQLMLRLAALRESKMELIEPAIEIYRQVLERHPESAEALQALERLGQNEEFELTIAEILEPLYRQSGDFHKLIGVHEVQVRRTDDIARRVELLHQIATLYEDAGDDTNSAFDTYARALAEDPAADHTQEALSRLAMVTNRFPDLAKVLETLAGTQEDVELGCALFTMSARVYEQQIGDLDSAIGHFRKVLELDSMNLDAAEALDAIFRGAERYAELSLILQQKSEILDDIDDRKNALFQSASIEEDVLEQHDAAIAVYNKVIELDSEDLRAVDALINLYLALSRWPDLLAVYQRKVDLVFDSEEKKMIYYQIGAVYERELSDVASSIDTYQRVLELDPDDLQALGRLDVLYQTAQNWPELLSVLQHESELAADPAESISYQYRIAELYEKHLEDVSRAIELYREILQQMPDHQPTLQALEGIKGGEDDPLGAALVLEPIYDATGEWLKLISTLEVQVSAAEDAFSKVDLLHRIARLHEEMIGDHQSAFDTYARSVQSDPHNDDSLASLERLGMTVGRWADVAALYDAELEKLLEDDATRYVELALRLAQIFEVQLEDVESAVARYRAVMAVDEENQLAVSSLDRLFTMTEQWKELVEILAREADIGQTPDEILEFKYRLGQVHQIQLNDLSAAIQAYREILAAAPEHIMTLEALEGLFAQGINQIEIAEILEPLYNASGDWEKLAGVNEASLTQLTEPEDRLNMYYRLAELQEERLIALDGALEVFIRALKEYPADERTLDDIERLAGSVDAGWESLANAYADVLGLHTDKDVQTSIGKRLARLFEEELGDITKAEETYRYVLGVEQLDSEALTNLDRIYTSLEQYPELAQVLEQRVLATEEEYELIELHCRLGQVYEERLVQLDDATRVFRKLFDELEPANELAIQALERIYTEKEQWQDLHMVLERELDNAAGDSHEADIRAKMAYVLADRLNDVPKAVETWRRVLDLRGADPEALHGLANLYERMEQWAELAEVLEQHYDIALEDEDRVGVLLRRAKLFNEQLGRDDAALDDYNRVLDVDYANLEALYAIAEIWRVREDPNELSAALHQTVDRAQQDLPAENQVALFRELGLIYEEKLEQPWDAVDAWRKLLEVDPRDFDAMAHLENILRGDERWEEVIEVKMQRAAAFEDPQEKIREYLEVASIWENQVGDRDRGTPAFEAILEIEPTHDQAYAALEQLHGEAKRAEPLIELYLARLESREEVSDRTDILRRVAKVFDEELDDKPQAFDACLTAFEMDFEDDQTVEYLEKTAQSTNRWAELVQTVNGWLQAQTEPRPKITLCLRLAKWYAEDLGHPDYAQPYYQQILKLDPNNVAVLRQMANFFKKSGRWQEQGQMLTQALNNAVDEADRKVILTELGEVLEKNAGEADQGLMRYKQALDVDPYFLPALEQLERIYTEKDLPAELVDILTRKAKALEEPEEVANVKLRTGGLYETSLGDVNKAGQEYREVLELDAANLLAMRGLERVYGATQAWQELIDVLEMQLDVVTTERERIDVLMKIGGIQEEHFLKSDLAAQRFEQVVEIDPNQEPAYVALEASYRKLRQWLDLIQTLDRHISATIDRETKIGLFGQMAVIYADEVEDTDRAIDAYLNIVDIDEANIPALDALAKLYEKQDDPAKAIEYMRRVADLTVEGGQRVEMYYRIGKQLDDKLGDRMQAQESYEMALDLDPTHIPTLGALRTIAMDAADWDRAARYIEQEQMNTEAPRQRAKLLVELGNLREEMLGEHELAVQSYELALQSDDDSEEAALPLVHEYIAQELWDRAEPLAEMLARKSSKRERNEQHDLHNLLGKVLAALDKNEPALKAYQQAHHFDLTNMDTIRGLAEVSFKMQDWPGSLTNFQKVLTSLEEDQTEERAYVYYKLGLIKQAQGQAKQAVNNFEKALGVEPTHRPTLEALVDTYANANDWKQVCHYRRSILDNVMDGDERYAMLNDLGDIWAEKEKNYAKAVEALEEARDIKPEDHALLHKLLQLYPRTEQWEQMADTLQSIADLEDQPLRKSRYLYTMAQLFRDKLDDQMRAVDLFNEALDLDPSYLEAFERINKILTVAKEWKQLERAYRKMLHRIAGSGKGDLEYSLWHALGLIYRDRLMDPTAAIESFRMSSRLKPGDEQEHLILAELFEQNDQLDNAVEEHMTILKQDPVKIDPYRRLYNIYLTKKTYDEAWCVAAALAFLREAGPEEQQFYEDYRPQGMIQVKSRIDNEMWVRSLFHEDENLYIGKIFEMIAAAALKAKIETLKQKKEMPVLDARFKQDPATSTVTFARTFGWAAQVLAINPCPALYVRSDVPGALVPVPAEPPSSVAGQTVLTGFTPQELTFIVGKHLAMYRGEHYIKTLFPTVTELTVLLFAGIKLAAPDAPSPPDIEKQVMATMQMLRQFMQPMQLEGLRMVVKKFLAEGGTANIKRWVQAVDITSARAGLLLCGDLEIAKKILAAEPQQPGDLPPQEKIKELLMFSVSENYFSLRRTLGISIGEG